MIETLLVTLIVATITGLCVLAYRHPNAYVKLHTPLVLLSIVVFGCIATWNIAVDLSEVSISRLEIPSEYMAQISSTLRDRKVPFVWAFLAFIAYNAFLLFLAILPRLIEDEKPDS